jgi:hypothetical protein
MSLCKYKNAIGEPNKGIHSYRLFSLGIVLHRLFCVKTTVDKKLFKK